MSNLSILENQQKTPDINQLTDNNEQRFLGVFLDQKINALIPLEVLDGVIEIPITQVLPIPEMPKFLLGIINWQGRPTWMIDLGKFMGNDRYTQSKSGRYTALLISMENSIVALVVEKVSNITSHNLEKCQSINGNISLLPQVSALLSGYLLDDEGKPWLLIDLAKILELLHRC